MFHKEGYKIITVAFLICAVLSLTAHFLIENELHHNNGLFLTQIEIISKQVAHQIRKLPFYSS